MESEVFKDFPGYEGIYQVSNLGRVKRLKRKTDHKCGLWVKEIILKPGISKKGYCVVNFTNKNREKKTYTVHRLVAIAFISNPLNLSTVNHIDGNKQNNDYSNLEWLSNADNMKHAIANNLITHVSGEKVKLSKLKGEQVLEIRRLVELGERKVLLANKYGVSVDAIYNIVNRITWKHI